MNGLVSLTSTIIEFLGMAAVVTGAWMFDYRAGIIVLGLVAMLIGLALDRGAPG